MALPAEPASLGEAARTVLLTSDAVAKAHCSRQLAKLWQAGALDSSITCGMPDRPTRPARPQLLAPAQMPKRGRGGTAEARIALLHALAHIELNAIDLAWDIVGRFGADLPRAFADDWVRIAAEEALHFLWLNGRLLSLGSHYGALPAHDGLWQSAQATRHDLIARLSVVPLVLEARGLDVTPQTVQRLQRAGDDVSAGILQRIYTDEISHVEAGVRWLRWRCESQEIDPVLAFREAIGRCFKGQLKPPFNHFARNLAGFSSEFYHSLA